MRKTISKEPMISNSTSPFRDQRKSKENQNTPKRSSLVTARLSSSKKSPGQGLKFRMTPEERSQKEISTELAIIMKEFIKVQNKST